VFILVVEKGEKKRRKRKRRKRKRRKLKREKKRMKNKKPGRTRNYRSDLMQLRSVYYSGGGRALWRRASFDGRVGSELCIDNECAEACFASMRFCR